jgi:CDP-diacylglycerol--serine O-phosphatidyltransferase
MAQFGRLRGDGKPRLLMGVHPLPTLITLGNLLCGFGAVVLAMRADNPPSTFHNFGANDCLYWAGILIFTAMVFDVMDGKVARWTKSTSKFGMEMDSLADVVSFGVAPAVLVKAMIDLHLKDSMPPYPLLDRFVFPMMAVYVACAALRLARYNVEAQTGHRDFFFGIPSPGAAGCVASLAVLIVPGTHHPPIAQWQDQFTLLDNVRGQAYMPVLIALPFVMLMLGILMVSRVHYPHVGDRLLRGRKSFMHLMVLGLSLVLVVMHHEVVLALAFNGYMVFGLVNEVRYQLFPKQRPAEWQISTEVPPASIESGPQPKPEMKEPPAG